MTPGALADERLHGVRTHSYENPRPELQDYVPVDARRVLDLGCSSGAFGAALRERQGCAVTGVELDPEYVAAATPRLDRVVQADLTTLAASDQALADLGRFDCLVCGDVLEHLVDPWWVLGRFTRVLDPGASVVVSLPNVRHWETFWQLGRHGTWPKRSQGVFDRTHLRWFTMRDAWDLLESTGFEVERHGGVPRLRPEGAPGTRLARALARPRPTRQFVLFQLLLRGRLHAAPGP